MRDHAEHGHHHDRGWRGALRYLRLAPKLWSSAVNRVAIEELQVRAGERVVDIGAGMGAGTVVAARAGAEVIAVEPTPFLRRVLAIRRLWQGGRARIHVVDGAAEHLPVADQSIDAVWAMNVMHHWTDADAALRELHRVMRGGGRVLLVDENFDDPAHPAHEEMQARRRRTHLHFDHVDPSTIGALLVEAGFVVDEAADGSFAERPAKVVRATKV